MLQRIIGDDVLSLLVDESNDVVKKEQMIVVLRYVDKFGIMKERFIGIIHVRNISSSTLKVSIDHLFNKHNLNLQQDNVMMEQAICVLVVVVVAKNYKGIRDFFDVLSTVKNVVCGSCKRKYILRESNKEILVKEIEKGEIKTQRGKNQEVTLARARDKRWGSHHRSITSLIKMFSEVVKVLHYVEEEGDIISNHGTTSGLIKHLQKSDQSILKAVSLAKGTKRAWQGYRATSFATLLKNEFGDRFSEGSNDLLDCMVVLSPHDSFLEFSVSKLVNLNEMYPRDFTYKERLSLHMELGVYYQIMRSDKDFDKLDGITKLAEKMVDKKKHTSHPLVYWLFKLALVLPVATATVERCFSKMKLIETGLCNRMGYDYFNVALTCAIEKEELINVKNEGVRKRFFAM
ncbi:zinc finger MYM-type protein 1-like protein [Tanacetum coccineum]